MSTEPVVVDLADLRDGKVDEVLEDAFGPDSLGIIIIRGLSEEYQQLRHDVLLGASQLAQLDPKELEKLEDEESSWLIGWSRGKEKLRNNEPDNLKGSYYINCGTFVHSEGLKDVELVDEKRDYPDLKGYVSNNLWPSQLPQFENNVKKLCKLIIDTATVVAQACDRFMVKKGIPLADTNYLEKIVRTSTTTKARLLHYFPAESTDDDPDDSWCGQHIDHSCLTGLTSAMLIDERADAQTELNKSPDPDAGLYIRNRRDQVVKVAIPKDCLAFQTGEALQLVTQNQFKAVPHYVRGAKAPGVARNTLAVFCQPSLHQVIDNDDYTFAQFCRDLIKRYH
ncbi:hypothetical protein TRICI_006801 [Trichomonascus ciferrii]|uniref:Uncharacterized protein n=1 Tax=Trichomonascus ciferrii TaxID=44093 RepID=A0A642UKB6_9ASCO|nr:hypothetical protein TRICI_006801 [Trichomonascus ciferrii]